MNKETKKILIVDDDELIRTVYANKFKEEGFEVMIAGDGTEAWALLDRGYVPDVVFSGVLMPKMGGFELVRKMRPDPRFTAIPIVISSHRGREEDKDEAIWLGVNDFLIQGVVPLVEAVRRINLAMGIKSEFYVPLVKNEPATEKFVRFMDGQTKASFAGGKGENLFVKFEPLKEAGEFKVSITDKPV